MPVQDLRLMTERPAVWLRSEAKLGTVKYFSSMSDLIVMTIWKRIRKVDPAVAA